MNQLKKKGFTLIEVVIVLAIGGLIIFVVLQAVSAARRSQRDNARKSQAGAISAALDQYASNNSGKYPDFTGDSFDDFYAEYAPITGLTYADAGDPGDDCGTQTADSHDVFYEVTGSGSSYDLSVCLEVGGESVVQTSN